MARSGAACPHRRGRAVTKGTPWGAACSPARPDPLTLTSNFRDRRREGHCGAGARSLRATDSRNADHPMDPALPVVWVASFPKSGNTWLRFLLARLLFGPLDSSAELDRRIPDVHSSTPNRTPPSHRGHVFVKTHWMFDVAPMRRWRTAAAIYILRDPRDMFVSLMRYTKATTPSDRDRLLVSFVECGGSMPLFLQFGFGSWTQHVESWLGRAASRSPGPVREHNRAPEGRAPWTGTGPGPRRRRFGARGLHRGDTDRTAAGDRAARCAQRGGLPRASRA